MNLADVTLLANGPVLELIQWLQSQNCIADPLRCTACNIPMELTQRNGNHVNRYFWYVYLSSTEWSIFYLHSIDRDIIPNQF